MAQMSDYLENAVINHVLRGTALPSPANVYMALYKTSPTDADTGTEVTGGSYARQKVIFGAPSDGVTSNSATISFPVATANWGTITHVGIRDNITGGNLLFHGALTTSKAINNEDKFEILAGNCTVTLQ